MKTVMYILFATSFLLWGCNNQPDKKNEQVQDNLTIENETIEQPQDYPTGDETIEPTKQNTDLFYLFSLYSTENDNVAFVSLSDIYPFAGEDSDSLALPNIEKMGIDAAQYFILNKQYRERLLANTQIAETDSVFVYDYSKNKLVSFLVKNLNAVAMINAYATEDDWPYPRYYYMIGFEINTKELAEFSNYYIHTLAYIGKENTFTQEPLTPVKWEKIAAKDFPSKTIKSKDASYIQNTTAGNAYLFSNDSLQYFLQDYLDEYSTVYARRLLVVNAETKDIIIEKLFGRGEGTSPSPLNYEDGYDDINQWTGKLFKNKPPVVFGFEYISFGCPSIPLIDKSNEEIDIYCDNRH